MDATTFAKRLMRDADGSVEHAIRFADRIAAHHRGTAAESDDPGTIQAARDHATTAQAAGDILRRQQADAAIARARKE